MNLGLADIEPDPLQQIMAELQEAGADVLAVVTRVSDRTRRSEWPAPNRTHPT